jgi:hypothetical protein
VTKWQEAALTSIGFFWMALWAFALGYLISSMIQVLVTRARMQRTMGTSGPKSVALGTFFGFISSSCSFAALSTTRSLFQKGAGLVPALAFMLASTNLVIELGIVIAVFLSWQFVAGEYVGGVFLILFAWLFVHVTRPKSLIQNARDRIEDSLNEHEEKPGDWREKVTSRKGWEKIGQQYGWKMSLYILLLLLSGLVLVSIILHYAMVWLDVLPQIGGGQTPAEQEFFSFDYRFMLNLVFLSMSAVMIWLWHRGRGGGDHNHGDDGSASLTGIVLRTLSGVAIAWLAGGLVVPWLIF